ncbi:MAG: nitrilase-related carbon-nitrogen hydrolase, partial [Acidimicrobiales bacterium]
WRTLLAARAIENTAYVVAAAQPGPTYTGHSLIAGPFGEVLAELGPDDGPVALANAEVRETRVEEARAALPVLDHRRYAVLPGRPGSRAV